MRSDATSEAAHAQRGNMPRRGPSEADLYLLYGFATAIVFLMGIVVVMRSRGRRMYDVEARGVALDWEGLRHLYRTGTYDVREREAWDSPAARATLTGIPPLKRASKQKRERQERKERRRRRREARDTPRDDLEAGIDTVLNLVHFRVRLVEVLQGHHGPSVGVDRKCHLSVLHSGSSQTEFFGRGRFAHARRRKRHAAGDNGISSRFQIVRE